MERYGSNGMRMRLSICCKRKLSAFLLTESFVQLSVNCNQLPRNRWHFHIIVNRISPTRGCMEITEKCTFTMKTKGLWNLLNLFWIHPWQAVKNFRVRVKRKRSSMWISNCRRCGWVSCATVCLSIKVERVRKRCEIRRVLRETHVCAACWWEPSRK